MYVSLFLRLNGCANIFSCMCVFLCLSEETSSGKKEERKGETYIEYKQANQIMHTHTHPHTPTPTHTHTHTPGRTRPPALCSAVLWQAGSGLGGSGGGAGGGRAPGGGATI